MIKKFLIGTFAVAALAFALTVSAAYDFGTTTLRVGSKGAAVMSVQTLVGATADGSFGPMTAAKVKVWQAANGLTADGVFGAKSKAVAMAGGSAPVVQGSCPTGYVATTPVAPLFASCVAATPVQGSCPTGYVAVTPVAPTFAACAVSTATPGTTVTGVTDGSITASTSSYISSAASIKKGETKDIVGVRLQAISGPVKVSYLDVQMSVRPWLFFNKLELRDSTGKVIATKTISSEADSTEITVGSLYQVRFDGLNYTVTPGTNVDLAVSATVLPATDKIVTTQAVTSNITSIKTISEVGYASTVTVGASTTTNTVTLTATGSVATLYTRLSPVSPLAGQQVISLTATTNDVTLGVFSLKSTNNTSSLNTLKIGLTTGTPADFSNFRLFVDGASIAGGSLSSGVITFSNLNLPLGLDTWKDFTVKADIIANPTATSVYTTLTSLVSNVVVTDANYGTATMSSTGNPSSGTLTLTNNSVVLSGAVATLGSAIVQSNSTVGYNATYAFTLTNSSNNDLYVSATPSTFVGMTTTGTSTTSTALTSLTVSSPSTAAGDTAGVSYVIPSGTARSFSFAATLRGASTTSTTFAANAINYNTASAMTGTAGVINTGLTSLTLTASF